MIRFVNNLLPVFIAVVLLYTACEEPDETIDDRIPEAMFLVSETDTLLLLTDKTTTVTVEGIFTETSENTVTNTGVMSQASYTYISTDMTAETISASRPDWYSSDEAVATVSDGKIKGRSAGTARIWAMIDVVVSDTLTVVVSSPQLPPDLILDPPPVQLVFQDSTVISGRITPDMDATVTVNGDTVEYNADGEFSVVVYLSVGNNEIPVIATNNANGLSSAKSKRIIYYPFDQAGITGHWSGETLTRPFSFEIYELLGVYVIDGTLTVDFTMLGGDYVVEDVVIAGLINADGTIDASLTRDWEGFEITGYLKGTFTDSGSAEGKYGIKIKREGWPTASASATWWAARDDD